MCQIDFTLGRCVADDHRMCMRAFSAVWAHKLLIKYLANFTLVFLFVCVESVSENTDSSTLPLQHTLVESGTASELQRDSAGKPEWQKDRTVF